MLTQLTGVTFNRTGLSALPSIFPYPQQLGAIVKAWFSADAGVVVTSGDVTTWTDRASGIVLSSATSPRPIIYTMGSNGLPGINTGQTSNGTSTDAFLRGPQQNVATPVSPIDFDYNTPFSVSIAFKVGAFTGGAANWQFLFGNSNANGLPGWWINTNETALGSGFIGMRMGNGAATWEAGFLGSSNSLAAGATGTITFTYSGSGGPTGVAAYVNGVPISTMSTAGAILSATILSTSIRWPTMFSDTTHDSPDTLFEVVVANTVLTSGQAVLMDKYLNNKWALHA